MPAGYGGLAAIIVGQMVSRASAQAILSRLADVAGAENGSGVIEPAAVFALTDADCRTIGLSGAKEAALKHAAAAVIAGRLDLNRIAGLPAPEAIAAMTAIRGIGPWTAEVYLLFCAGHVDIFPAGDMALRAAIGHAFSRAARPGEAETRAIAQAWAPWRGVAARLMWAYYAQVVRREVTPAG
jgi:DNA-3-methyladenine glycosylase II